MANLKYGPITIVEDDTDADVDYSIEYKTVSQVLSIYRNDEYILELGYESSRAIGELIAEWYLVEVLEYDFDIVVNILSKKNSNNYWRYKLIKLT